MTTTSETSSANLLAEVIRDPRLADLVVEFGEVTLANVASLLDVGITRGLITDSAHPEFVEAIDLARQLQADSVAQSASFLVVQAQAWQTATAALALESSPPPPTSFWTESVSVRDKAVVVPNTGIGPAGLMLYAVSRSGPVAKLTPTVAWPPYTSAQTLPQPCELEYVDQGDSSILVCKPNGCTGRCVKRRYLSGGQVVVSGCNCR
jgi:hypothetical protein